MLSRNTFCTQFATGREWLFSSHTLQTKKKILCASQKIEKENTKDLTVELCQIASVCIRKRIIMSLQYWLILLYYVLRMNFYNHHIRSIFKSHFISVTFKFCAVHIALCALEPCSTDSLGTQHRANESNTNRMT